MLQKSVHKSGFVHKSGVHKSGDALYFVIITNFLIDEPQQVENLYVEQEKTSWWRNFKDGFRKRFRRRSDNYDSDSEAEESDDHGEEIDEDLILKGTKLKVSKNQLSKQFYTKVVGKHIFSS